MKKIVSTVSLKDEISACLDRFKPTIILMGNATWSKKLRPRVKEAAGSIPLKLVNEKHSTERARIRYLKANPPGGLWKLLPITLQVPGEPYDDFAAIVLAEDYIDGRKAEADRRQRRAEGRNGDGEKGKI